MLQPSNCVLFYGTSSPFSQFHPCLFTAKISFKNSKRKREKVTFSCAEQFMMYVKALTFEDFKIAKKILEETSPRKMKALGRRVKNFDDDVWDDVKFNLVVSGNRLKFSQNKKLKKALLSTNEKILIEASPRDRIWGVGLGSRNPDIFDRTKWRGQNLLGKALMKVRKELL